MKAVVQRVLRAELRANGEAKAAIGRGLVALVGIQGEDTQIDRVQLAEKLVHLRIFEDEQGKMNLSTLDVLGELLLVPNFTVAGSTAKGRRPSFDGAMRPELAKVEFDALVRAVAGFGVRVQTGVFGAHMEVELVNDGPVTLLLATRG